MCKYMEGLEGAYVVVNLGFKTPCWMWQRCIASNGYGQLRHKGVTAYAHRYYYEKVKGPIPANLTIDHLCFHKSCVNPEHMEVVTLLENQRRGDRFGRRGGRPARWISA